jgi:hypothetical protein
MILSLKICLIQLLTRIRGDSLTDACLSDAVNGRAAWPDPETVYEDFTAAARPREAFASRVTPSHCVIGEGVLG